MTTFRETRAVAAPLTAGAISVGVNLLVEWEWERIDLTAEEFVELLYRSMKDADPNHHDEAPTGCISQVA